MGYHFTTGTEQDLEKRGEGNVVLRELDLKRGKQGFSVIDFVLAMGGWKGGWGEKGAVGLG